MVGGGPELKRLQRQYGHAPSSPGAWTTGSSLGLYSEAAALVIPGVEEFGVAAVESQAAGRPVVAIDAGGVRETVVPGRTGVLVENGDAAGLARALGQDLNCFDPLELRANAQRFSPGIFASRMKEIVESKRGGISTPLAHRGSPIPS